MAAPAKVVDVSKILANIVGFLPGDPLNLGLIGSNSAGGFDPSSAGQFDILVYWEREALKRGLFMVVRPNGPASGQLATLFSPSEGKRYFDFARYGCHNWALGGSEHYQSTNS